MPLKNAYIRLKSDYIRLKNAYIRLKIVDMALKSLYTRLKIRCTRLKTLANDNSGHSIANSKQAIIYYTKAFGFISVKALSP
jgi:hypothetical protein